MVYRIRRASIDYGDRDEIGFIETDAITLRPKPYELAYPEGDIVSQSERATQEPKIRKKYSNYNEEAIAELLEKYDDTECKEYALKWYVKFNTLEEFTDFLEAVGSVIIEKDEIMIYDHWVD